jgi:cell division protein FtsW (lipid II flippase)
VVYAAWWDGTRGDLWPAAQRAALLVTARPLEDGQRQRLTPEWARQRGAALQKIERDTGKNPWLARPYQLGRIRTFFDPRIDPRGTGWNILQSLDTIGFGGLTGSASGYSSLPKNVAYNDFIFSIIGLRVGFVGGALFILGHTLLIVSVLSVGARARDPGGMLVCAGVATLLFAHFFENVGMTIKVVPITGIPLPFTSLGGSFLVTCMAGLGLVQSVWINRKSFYSR